MSSTNWPSDAARSPYWADPVASQAALPATGQVVGEIRLTLDTDDLYQWNGSSWERITENLADVQGPASSTDDAIVRFDGTTGKLVQNSVVTVSDAGVIAGSSIDADTNTLTNIEDDNIKAAAAIAVNKLAALTASRAVVSDVSGFLSPSATTAVELGYVNGVTSAIQTQLDAMVEKAGDTMTGDLILAGDPDTALKAATKQYVDSVAAGLDIKPSVKVATNANITLSGEQTIDGVLTSASRVLVKAQTATEENGIYVSSAGAWTRAADMDSWAEVPGAFCFIEEGTLYQDTAFVCTADEGGTLGTTPITWSQFAGVGTYSADGDGLELTGTVFGLELDGTTLTKGPSGLKVTGASVTEISYLIGVSSAIQTQLNTLQTNIDTLEGEIDAARAVAANVAVSSDVTLTDRRLHLVDTSAARSLALPAVSATLFLVLKDVSGLAQTNNITITTPGAETIDGASTLVIDWNYGSVTIVSDGTNYFAL